MDSMMSMLVFELQEAQFPTSRLRPLYRPLAAKDGYVIVAPVSQRIFVRMCEAIGRPDMVADPRFSQISEREQHWDAMMGNVEQWVSERTAKEAEFALSTAGVACSRYLTPAEALQQPQLAHRGTLATVEDSAGPFLVVNPPFQMSDSPCHAGSSVPNLGQDTDAILRDLAGLNDRDVNRLRTAGAIR